MISGKVRKQNCFLTFLLPACGYMDKGASVADSRRTIRYTVQNIQTTKITNRTVAVALPIMAQAS